MLPSTYIWSPGDTVHLVNRGVHKDPIFRDSDDCNYFLHLMSRMRKKGQCEIEAYVLLYNHFHILAKTGDVPLSKCLQNLQSPYARYFNTKYRLTGHLFEAKCYAGLIRTDSQLLVTSRYIHLNPVKAGLVTDPALYQYSSYPVYLGLMKNDLVTPDRIFSLCGPGDPVADYQEYVESSDTDFADPEMPE